MQIYIPSHIELALNMLKLAGFESYIVGGCVRDSLINKLPNDWDICTSALPSQTCEIFKNFKMVLNGAKHGTIRVIINHLPVEITTFRIDGKYLNNRSPENISFTSSLKEDLIRRDFTINAMAYSNESGIIDLYGGKKDLEQKLIKCVGNAEERFEEDALRIMRALRFASQLNFKIEEKTKAAIFTKKDLLKNISAERITEEFLKLISYDNCFRILDEFAEVIRVFMPHFSNQFKKISASTDIRVNLAYILSASKCDYEHIFGVLKIPTALKKDVITILNSKNIVINADKIEIKQHLFTFGEDLLKLILEFKSCYGEDTDEQIKIIDDIIANNQPYLLRHLKISGNDIKGLGVCSGEKIGNILNYLLKRVISEKLANRKSYLIEEAQKYILKNKF